MAKRPGVFALVAALICALAGVGFVRFGVDAGPDLLVGRNSDAWKVYDQFSRNFGADPIVVVLSVQNPTAYYLERNLLRMAALESDIAKDSRVATVLGPGTIVGAAQRGAVGEINRVSAEYPYFVAETALANAVQKGEKDTAKLSQVEDDGYRAAALALLADVVKATQDAASARSAYSQHLDQHQNDQVLRGVEQAAEKAASQTQPPPLFAEYLAGPSGTVDQAAAQALFDRLTAGFGICSGDIAKALSVQPSCQVFLERLLLDLPSCPPQSTHRFCTPKSQWAAVLPAPKPNGPSYAVISVRLKPEVIGHADQVNALVAKIRDELDHGHPKSSDPTIKSLGAFVPTECGSTDTSNGQQSACDQRYHDDRAQYVIAGAPLLVQGVVGAMTHLLLALFPVALLVMLLLLLGVFRVRGWMWPLLGAAGAALLTVGGGLLLGVPISPAVLAGVPVLVGLGVDYAVQLVARFSEERRRGLGVEAALRTTLGNTGPATLVAGAATLAGVAALALLTAFDLGPLTAVPLIAQFAVVLFAGVVFSWLAAVLVALPAAAWQERRRERAGIVAAADEDTAAAAPVAARTSSLATRWRALLVPAVILGLLGWALMPRVPVETSVERLLAPSLDEVRDIDQVRAAIGYDNEVDFAVQGNIGGDDPRATVPNTVLWMAQAGTEMRCQHPGDVALAITIGDVYTASAENGGTATSCTQPGGGGSAPSPSPSASPSPGSTPSAQPSSPPARTSPSARRESMPGSTPGPRVDGDIVRAGRAVAQATSPAPSPAASPSAASPSAVPAPTPAPSPQISSPAASGTLQTAFLCSLRLLPPLARNLVGPIPLNTQPCPPRELYRNVFLSPDPSPIDPTMGRIALGVRLTSIGDQAKLIDATLRDAGTPPAGLTITPTGLTALAADAYGTLTGRILLLNLVPLAVVALVLLLILREPRRALLPVLPAGLAAGWSSLVVLLLGRLPGAGGTALGSLNPLTVVLGALVIALSTEFGVVLLQRFYEERARGLDPDRAAGAALHAVGRAIVVSALTLGAGFLVLALSGLAPGGLPLIADFGLAVLIDLALAVAAVFVVMLPLAVALERSRPLPLPVPAPAGFRRPPRAAQPEGFRRPPRQRRSAAAAPAVRDEEAVSEASAEPDLAPAPATAGPAKKHAEAAAVEEVWEPPAEPPVAPSIAGGSPEDVEVRAAEEVGKAPEGPEGATTSRAAVPDAPPPSAPRFPGMSGRRRTAAPEQQPAGEGPAPSRPAAPARLPGLSGRRRVTASSPDPTPRPVEAAAAPAEPPRPRRLPGGVVRRHGTPSAPEAEPRSVTPTGQPPAERAAPPVPRRHPDNPAGRAAPTTQPADHAPPRPRPGHDTSAPGPADAPPRPGPARGPSHAGPRPPRSAAPAQPTGGASEGREPQTPPPAPDAPRSRRRRPPPWVRRANPRDD